MGMTRKVNLFLLAVMLAVSLGAMVVASIAMYRLVSDKQAEEIHQLEISLSQRFAVFERMLRSQHERIVAHMDRVLPEIVAEIERTGRRPQDLSVAELDALARRNDIQHIYFIDRAHRVFQTNLVYDLGLGFEPSPFTRFLDSVYGRGKVMNDGIDLSAVTGTLRTYSYFGPVDRDYIVEISTEIRASLAEGGFGWMAGFFFQDLFNDAVASNPYVKDLDLYLYTPAGTWSLLHVGKKLEPALAERVHASRREEMRDGGGRYLTTFSGEETRAASDPEHPVSSKFVIRQITYDTGLARQAVLQVFLGSLAVLAAMLPVVFWLASRLLRRQLLDPLLNLRGEAGAIAEGDLDQPIADTARKDEIGQLARSFASMRSAVRGTITDLRRTNVAIERFVPRAFLAIVGKPSIVDVQLGDNKRQEMSILFSDIRSFTSLSESLTPDENFAFLNAYLERMGPVIRDHDGFIDKYIGDAIMALFFDADAAVRAGLAMLDTLAQYNAERAAAGLPPIAIGIGINSGSLMLGTIGEHHRMDGTVISDAVNLAARIEDLTKRYKKPMLISEHTRRRLADPAAYDIRPVDTAVVKGKTQPVALYEVHGPPHASRGEVSAQRTEGA
ncbi:MAG: adenylate/guanylate cyclase domain-containing protein [Reyranellaceae bacterium]